MMHNTKPSICFVILVLIKTQTISGKSDGFTDRPARMTTGFNREIHDNVEPTVAARMAFKGIKRLQAIEFMDHLARLHDQNLKKLPLEDVSSNIFQNKRTQQSTFTNSRTTRSRGSSNHKAFIVAKDIKSILPLPSQEYLRYSEIVQFTEELAHDFKHVEYVEIGKSHEKRGIYAIIFSIRPNQIIQKYKHFLKDESKKVMAERKHYLKVKPKKNISATEGNKSKLSMQYMIDTSNNKTKPRTITKKYKSLTNQTKRKRFSSKHRKRNNIHEEFFVNDSQKITKINNQIEKNPHNKHRLAVNTLKTNKTRSSTKRNIQKYTHSSRLNPEPYLDHLLVSRAKNRPSSNRQIGSRILQRYDSQKKITEKVKKVIKMGKKVIEKKKRITDGRKNDTKKGKRFTERETKNSKVKAPSAPIIYIEAGIHAREWISPAVALFLAQNLAKAGKSFLRHATWIIVPLANPDGYEYSHTTDRLWRKNMAPNQDSSCMGVDLNRNWGWNWGGKGSTSDPCRETYMGSGPFSEPETRSQRNLMLALRDHIKAFLSLHSYGQIILYSNTPSNKTASRSLSQFSSTIANRFKALGQYSYQSWRTSLLPYAVSGDGHDYAMSLGIPYALTMELPDEGDYGFLLPAQQIEPIGDSVWKVLVCQMGDVVATPKARRMCQIPLPYG